MTKKVVGKQPTKPTKPTTAGKATDEVKAIQAEIRQVTKERDELRDLVANGAGQDRLVQRLTEALQQIRSLAPTGARNSIVEIAEQALEHQDA